VIVYSCEYKVQDAKRSILAIHGSESFLSSNLEERPHALERGKHLNSQGTKIVRDGEKFAEGRRRTEKRENSRGKSERKP
jgi:hypothetical protein